MSSHLLLSKLTPEQALHLAEQLRAAAEEAARYDS
jgi:hypothetical protein